MVHLPHGIIIMSKMTTVSQNETFKYFQPFQNVVQVHQVLRLPRNMTPKATSHFDVQKVPQLPRGWKSVRCHAPVPQNDVLDCHMSRKCSSKNEHGALVKRDLQKRSLRDIRFVRACAFEMHMDISQGNFSAVKAKTAHTYETTSNEHRTKPIINYL